jgi:hypothetical protein
MKSLTALLAVATALCLSQMTLAAALADGPTVRLTPPSAQQDLRAPDLVSSAVAAHAQGDLRSLDASTAVSSLAAVVQQDLRAARGDLRSLDASIR